MMPPSINYILLFDIQSSMNYPVNPLGSVQLNKQFFAFVLLRVRSLFLYQNILLLVKISHLEGSYLKEVFDLVSLEAPAALAASTSPEIVNGVSLDSPRKVAPLLVHVLANLIRAIVAIEVVKIYHFSLFVMTKSNYFA